MRTVLLAACLATATPVASQITGNARPGGAETLASLPPMHAHEAVLRTGVRLRYVEQGDADGRPVVLLHGLADSWFSFSRTMPMLPASWRVLAIDQRGHGDSDRPASGYTIADFADDVLALLDTLAIPRATIVGHSLGAFVAQRVAIIAPDRVEKLVLIDGAPSARNAVLMGLRGELAALPPRMPDDFLRAFQYSTVHGAVPEVFMERVIAESAKVPTRVALGALDGLLAAGDSSRLGMVRAPTLLLWGEHDGIFSAAAQRDLQRGIAAAKLQVYSGAGHAPHWETPDRVVRDLRQFVGAAR